MTRRNTRRIWVVIYYLILFALFPFIQNLWWEMLAFLVLLFASPAAVTGTELLKALNDPEAKADERQRVMINEIIKQAYWVLAAVLIIPAFFLGFTDDLPLRIGTGVERYITGHLFDFLTLAILFSTLPPAVMMWLEPDPVEDEVTATPEELNLHPEV